MPIKVAGDVLRASVSYSHTSSAVPRGIFVSFHSTRIYLVQNANLASVCKLTFSNILTCTHFPYRFSFNSIYYHLIQNLIRRKYRDSSTRFEKKTRACTFTARIRIKKSGAEKERNGERSRVRVHEASASDPLGRGGEEASRVWFRVDRGESRCIAPVGATSWLRAFVVVTRGRTPVADSAESCTT